MIGITPSLEKENSGLEKNQVQNTSGTGVAELSPKAGNSLRNSFLWGSRTLLPFNQWLCSIASMRIFLPVLLLICAVTYLAAWADSPEPTKSPNPSHPTPSRAHTSTPVASATPYTPTQ
jgi:hypothetical protein